MLKHLLTTLVIAVFLATGCQSERETASDRPGPKPDGAMEPLRITDANFQSEVLDSKWPVLVDFWAARCSPCLEMKPAIRELVADFAGRATIGQLDVDANQLVPERYAVRQLPTVLIFRNGEAAKRLGGLRSKEELTLALNAVIASSH